MRLMGLSLYLLREPLLWPLANAFPCKFLNLSSVVCAVEGVSLCVVIVGPTLFLRGDGGGIRGDTACPVRLRCSVEM